MTDVQRWLSSLGLGEYADAFAKNAIEWDLLPALDHELLEAIGVAVVGHRMRILKAAAAVPEQSAADPSGADAAPTTNRPVASGEAERRQLTVMFADLVGSTGLSQRFDPEELREINRTYQDAATAAIEEHGGYVARYMGDGVLAYFGYPFAREDDAERAVGAGLALARSVPALRGPAELAVRVGIATGPVVVGDLIGEGASQESAVVGETPNLAARLQGEADQNQVVVSESTRRLVQGFYELKSLGPRRLRGFSGARGAWLALGARMSPSRFQARRGQAGSSLVGRDSELALLRARWRTSVEGEGQVVLLGGEPGIGKSRLAEAMVQDIAGDAHLTVRYQCAPFHVNSAFSPFIQQLQHAARIEPRDEDDAKLDKLEALLHGGADRPETSALFASLLSLPASRYPALSLTAEQQRAATLAALIGELEVLCDAQPALVLFEDAQWADPSSREVLDALVDAVQRLPALLLITHRPEFGTGWDTHGHVTELRLNRLAQRDGAAIVRQIAGGKHVPPEMIRQMLERTDGIPLFVEELTKSVLESGVLNETTGWQVPGRAHEPLVIPESLTDLLMARLDRLGAAKELAQLASVIGRGFDYELLARVSGAGTEGLRARLDALLGSGLVYRSGRESAQTYEYKHALVRDAAYESLLRSTRQAYHQKIAAALEEGVPGHASPQPELLAHHFTEARCFERAIPYWQAAGNLAARASANAEAIEHLTRGLSLLDALEESEAHDRQALDLLFALLAPLSAATGHSSSEAEAAVTRALALCERTGETMRIFPVLYGCWGVRYVRGDGRGCLELAEEIFALARNQEDSVPRIAGRRLLGTGQFVTGDPASARRHLEAAAVEFDEQRHGSLELSYSQDLGVSISCYLALTTATLGYPEKAAGHMEEALRRARRADHPNTLAYTLTHARWLAWVVDDTQGLGAHAQELASLTESHSLPMWAAFADTFAGALASRRDQPAEGLGHLEQAERGFQRTKAGLFRGVLQLFRAENLLRLGRLEAMASALDLAASHIERSGIGFIEPEHRRLRAKLQLSHGGERDGAAVDELRLALRWSKDHHVRLWELRAATELGKLWAAHGRRADAHALVAPLYEWFTQGHRYPDLRNAKALLDEL